VPHVVNQLQRLVARLQAGCTTWNGRQRYNMDLYEIMVVAQQ
jgi:hypothetical protein